MNIRSTIANNARKKKIHKKRNTVRIAYLDMNHNLTTMYYL